MPPSTARSSRSGLACTAADITQLVRMAEQTGRGKKDGRVVFGQFALLFALPPYKASRADAHLPWLCENPRCRYENQGFAEICVACGEWPRPDLMSIIPPKRTRRANMWSCSGCSFDNSDAQGFCEMCGQANPANERMNR